MYFYHFDLGPSGDEAFPYVEEKDVELALKQLVDLDALVAVGFAINAKIEIKVKAQVKS